MTGERRQRGLRLERGRVLVDEQGWTGLVDVAADPDPERFAAALGAPRPDEISTELHWTVRAHIQATLGVDLVGRSRDGTAVGLSASSDGERSLLLLDTVPGRWGDGQEPVTIPDQPRQVLPGLAAMLPVALLDLMQVGPCAGLGLAEPEVLDERAVAALLWQPGAVDGGGAAGRLLASSPWRHWRLRATSRLRGGEQVEDGTDVVVLPDGMLVLEAVGHGLLELREASPSEVLRRVVEIVRPGLAGPTRA